MANNVQCPACFITWPVTEADLGLQSCPSCGAALEVTRTPVAWQYEAVVVTAVKADDEKTPTESVRERRKSRKSRRHH